MQIVRGEDNHSLAFDLYSASLDGGGDSASVGALPTFNNKSIVQGVAKCSLLELLLGLLLHLHLHGDGAVVLALALDLNRNLLVAAWEAFQQPLSELYSKKNNV